MVVRPPDYFTIHWLRHTQASSHSVKSSQIPAKTRYMFTCKNSPLSSAFLHCKLIKAAILADLRVFLVLLQSATRFHRHLSAVPMWWILFDQGFYIHLCTSVILFPHFKRHCILRESMTMSYDYLKHSADTRRLSKLAMPMHLLLCLIRKKVLGLPKQRSYLNYGWDFQRPALAPKPLTEGFGWGVYMPVTFEIQVVAQSSASV